MPFEQFQNSIEKEGRKVSNQEFERFTGMLGSFPHLQELSNFLSSSQKDLLPKINNEIAQTEKKYLEGKYTPEKLSTELSKTHQEINDYEKHYRDIEKILDDFSESIGFDVRTILHSAEIHEDPLPFDRNFFGAESVELNPRLQEMVNKKLLVDLAVQGFSLNAFGGYHVFMNEELPEEQKKLYTKEKYLGKMFHTLSVFGERIHPPQGLPMGVLGRAEVTKKDGKLGFSVFGVDESILTQELFKGFYEYLVLDTSIPAKGSISEEEAQFFEKAISGHMVEPIGFVLGPIVAQKLVEHFNKLTEKYPEKVRELIELRDDNAPPLLTQALLFKVATMLPYEKLKKFYEKALADGEVNIEDIQELRDAKNSFYQK